MKRLVFGRFFEDFAVGEDLEHWPGRTVGQGDHRAFCMLTMNVAHEGPEVHVGYLYSLLLGLAMSDVSANAIHHTESGVKVLEPVFEGTTIYARTSVLAKEDVPNKPDRGLVTFSTRGFTHEGALFMSLERQMAIRRRT